MHDDVIKWKHFPRYWPFVREIHRPPANFPHKGHWRGVLMFSLICAWINGWVNNREAGDLRHHRAHYDVTLIPRHELHGPPTTGIVMWQCPSLIHWGRMTHICVTKQINHNWFRQWLVAWLVPSHYLNQCWNIVIWTLRNKTVPPPCIASKNSSRSDRS